MACDQVKSMRFRVYVYDPPHYSHIRDGYDDASNADAAYHDTGKEFTISEDDKRALGVSNVFGRYTIPRLLFKKVYNWVGGHADGWSFHWSVLNVEGYIGSYDRRHWHLKRIL